MEIIRQGTEECRDSRDHWLLGTFLCETVAFACMTGRLAEAREAAPGAIQSFRSLENDIGVEWMIERLALLAACEGKMREAALLAGYCNNTLSARQMPRGSVQIAVQERVAAMLEKALPPDQRAALMRQGAAWSSKYAYDAALAIVA